MGFRGIITYKEGEELMRQGRLFRRKLPVKALKLTSRVSVESRTGVIETGHPGDYLVQDVIRPRDFWIIRKEVFENEFELAPATEPKNHNRQTEEAYTPKTQD